MQQGCLLAALDIFEARAPQGTREEWLGILQTLAEQIQKEQQTSQRMVQEMMNTYMQLLSTPGTYLAGQAAIPKVAAGLTWAPETPPMAATTTARANPKASATARGS